MSQGSRVQVPPPAIMFFFKKKKMSDNIFNQNQNSLAINNNIMDYEPNVNSGSSKVILGIEKKLMAFDVDPNILKTGLNNYLIQNSILLSKGNIRDSVIIKEIISKVDQLSNNLMKVVEDIKEKFDAIEDALYKYSEYNENNINSTNVKINSLNEYNENFKKDQMNLINTFQNNYLFYP